MDTSIDQARFNMIQQQIRPWNVANERVLATMDEIPRERFVPDAYLGLAYADVEIPIGDDQKMLSPKLAAHLLQALNIQPGEKVLEVGTGTGYVTACLSHLGGQVASVEIREGLAEQARATLQGLDLPSVQIRDGDGLEAPVQGQPFDAIALTGSVPDRSALVSLQEQLTAGGRLFAVVGVEPIMEAMLVTRVGQAQFRDQILFETCIPALEKAPEPEQFVF